MILFKTSIFRHTWDPTVKGSKCQVCTKCLIFEDDRKLDNKIIEKIREEEEEAAADTPTTSQAPTLATPPLNAAVLQDDQHQHPPPPIPARRDHE